MGRDNDLFEGLAHDLEAAGEADGEELLSRWFDTAVAIASTTVL